MSPFVPLKQVADSILSTLQSNITSIKAISEALKMTKTFDDNGPLLEERFSTYITSWQVKTATVALNILRFIGASKFVPQNRFRLLSYFNPEIIPPATKPNIPGGAKPRTIMAEVMTLSKVVSTVTSAIKDIVSVFKSSSSTTITRITRFDFNYFNQKSTVLKAIDIPARRTDEFIRALIIDYNLPSKGSFMLDLTYSDDFAWDSVQYLYSFSMNELYRSLALLKNGDSVKDTASFFIVHIDANWNLAPDLLIITRTKSTFGGL